MKKCTFLIVLLSFLFAYTYSQTVTSRNAVPGYNELRTKARKQKTAAWICLGSGLALFTTGIIIDAVYLPVSILDNSQPLPAGAQIAAFAGVAGIAASIPLFIAASKNKHKAKLMLTNQKTATGLPVAVPKNITSITLSIPL